mgnify:CR=1 FL=1
MALDTAKITLPKTVVTNIINKASGVSTIAALSQSQPQLFADATHMVFSPSSEAEIVGEGKTKGSYEQAFTPVPAKIVKLVTTTRTTDELKYADEDNRLEILKLIQQDQLGALARGLDYAVYHGVSAKSGTKVTELTPLTDGAVSVTATTDQAANIDALADAVMDACAEPNGFTPLYAPELPFAARIDRVARDVYGADGVDMTPLAQRKLKELQERPDAADLGLCMVKTQYSLSDDPVRKGAPTGWRLRVRDVMFFGGAGLVVPVAGDISLMPGTGSRPAFRKVDVDVETGQVTGLF